MKQQFITALEQNNRELIRQIPKGDLHNHITRGGNKRYITAWCDTAIPECPTFKDLGEMNWWNARYIKPLLPGRIGYEKRIEAAFVQAKTDGVQLLHMSVTMGEEEWFNGSIATLIHTIQGIHQRVAPEIHFVPELTFLLIHQSKKPLRGSNNILSITTLDRSIFLAMSLLFRGLSRRSA